MQYHAIPCNTMQYHAIPCNTMQYHAIPCNTMQYHAIPCNTMHYHAIPCNTVQYHAVPCNTVQPHAISCNTMQYHAIPCNTMQYHASLITANGAYHFPVGSIWPFLFATPNISSIYNIYKLELLQTIQKCNLPTGIWLMICFLQKLENSVSCNSIFAKKIHFSTNLTILSFC